MKDDNNEKIVELLTHYLKHNYFIQHNYYFNSFNGTQEWGKRIVSDMFKNFSVNIDLCESVFKAWAIFENKLEEKHFYEAWEAKTLKTVWPQSLERVVKSTEKEFVKNYCMRLYKETGEIVFIELINKINNIEELLGIIKCVGFELTVFYNPTTPNTLQRFFVSTFYYDKINARQNNHLWQDWVRTRG